MPILIFKTDLHTIEQMNSIRPILDLHPGVIDWSIDQEDIDNVLRIIALKTTTEADIISLLAQFNITCETLKN